MQRSPSVKVDGMQGRVKVELRRSVEKGRSFNLATGLPMCVPQWH